MKIATDYTADSSLPFEDVLALIRKGSFGQNVTVEFLIYHDENNNRSTSYKVEAVDVKGASLKSFVGLFKKDEAE